MLLVVTMGLSPSPPAAKSTRLCFRTLRVISLQANPQVSATESAGSRCCRNTSHQGKTHNNPLTLRGQPALEKRCSFHLMSDKASNKTRTTTTAIWRDFHPFLAHRLSTSKNPLFLVRETNTRTSGHLRSVPPMRPTCSPAPSVGDVVSAESARVTLPPVPAQTPSSSPRGWCGGPAKWSQDYG